MDNLINGSIGYFGNVKVTYKLNDKVKTVNITNSGTNFLFKALAEHLLSGNYTLEGKPFPKVAYMTLSADEFGSDNTPELLYDYLNISAVALQAYEKPSYTLRVTTSLVRSYLTNECLDRIKSAYDNFYLRLMSDKGEQLAYVKLPLSVLEAIDTGIQALIQWDLTFTNKIEKY